MEVGRREAELSAVRSALRPASVAEIGGFRPDLSAPHSWFNGNFWLPTSLPWPTTAAGPMVPVLQVLASELPHRPPALSNIAVLWLFWDAEPSLPLDVSENGEGWLIVTAASATDLQMHRTSTRSPRRPFQVRWRLVPDDAPVWSEIDGLVSSEAMRDDLFSEAFFRDFRCVSQTKVGGYRSFIQDACNAPVGYVFQVATEPKASWGVADSGNMYFHLHDGTWRMAWDCY
jgi:hypothetical protein